MSTHFLWISGSDCLVYNWPLCLDGIITPIHNMNAHHKVLLARSVSDYSAFIWYLCHNIIIPILIWHFILLRSDSDYSCTIHFCARIVSQYHPFCYLELIQIIQYTICHYSIIPIIICKLIVTMVWFGLFSVQLIFGTWWAHNTSMKYKY